MARTREKKVSSRTMEATGDRHKHRHPRPCPRLPLLADATDGGYLLQKPPSLLSRCFLPSFIVGFCFVLERAFSLGIGIIRI